MSALQQWTMVAHLRAGGGGERALWRIGRASDDGAAEGASRYRAREIGRPQAEQGEVLRLGRGRFRVISVSLNAITT